MDGKTETLLSEAERQKHSDEPGESSVCRAERTFENETAAREFFEKLTNRIVQIHEWKNHSAISDYSHFNARGEICEEKTLVVGEFIRISLPGSGKYDWIKIVEISDTPDEFILTVQPSRDPTKEFSVDKSDNKTTSHFFSGESTNNFCLKRAGKTIHFYVIGLNEQTNTDETDGIIETVRNFAASNLGYYFGIQKTEWTTFAENFLENES